MDGLLWQAREAHQKSCEHSRLAEQFRHQRDKFIRELYATGDYSYRNLAKQIGCSTELVAKVIQGRQ
jgi:hypothetical protein